MDEIRENRKNEQRALTREELDRILDAPDPQTRAGIRDRAILELLGGAGLKVQELVTLRVENIDLQISCVLLPENPENPESPGSSASPERMVPFGKKTRESLMKYLYDVRREIESPSDLLFPGRSGKMITRQAVWKLVKKHALAAGIRQPVSPEDLRTALAVSLLQKGADPSTVQSLLGIRSAAMHKYFLAQKGADLT